jgi:hypothetical protein
VVGCSHQHFNRFNGFFLRSNFERLQTVETVGSDIGQLDHRAEATVRMRSHAEKGGLPIRGSAHLLCGPLNLKRSTGTEFGKYVNKERAQRVLHGWKFGEILPSMKFKKLRRNVGRLR